MHGHNRLFWSGAGHAQDFKHSHMAYTDGNRRPNWSRVVLGHESLGVTLAYLKGKDAESEEAKEHATAAVWRCTHKS